MSREAVVDAIVVELERAAASLRSALRMALELQRPPGRRSRRDAPESATAMDLRFSGMSVTEAAALLRVSEEHLRRLLRGGEVIGVPYGGRIGWRLHREYVEALHDQMTADREGKDAARRGVIPGTPPPGRPRKATRRRPR